jgi:glycosyltransferase involved in cell wall biosynthesis
MLRINPNDGISRFTFEVVKRLTADNPSHRFILIFDRKPDEKLIFSSNVEVIIASPSARHPLQWYAWHEWQIPGILKKSGTDIFLSPDGIISLKSTIPSIPVIHDISFFHRPGDVPLLTSLYYRHFFLKFAHRGARIITVSEFCRRDISSSYMIDPDKIDVAHNGVADYFIPAERNSIDEYRKVLTGGVPYFLFVGNFSPRKNIPGLVKSYDSFRRTSVHHHKLILAGGRLFLNRETDMMIRSSPWRNDIILTGSMLHSELRMLYASATALVFVPWFEGFGIPAAESMRCGTPAILSSTTSLPEIGGDAALYADPGDPEEIAASMKRIASDDELRLTLSSAGIRQSMKFNWENTAKSVWETIDKVATARL